MIDETSTELIYVPNARATYPLLQEMWVERGTREDWLLLRHLHYKLHTEPVGAKYWRLRFRGETIGALVFGMSRPLLKERHAAFPQMCPGRDSQISNIHRYATVNDNFRVVGRFVVDTMFRSSGVAYRFLNLACRQIGFTYLEIQSSMSKFNTFAQSGGFLMVKPIRSIHYEKGLNFMRRWFASHPADQEALMEEFARMSPHLQARVERELKTFYFDHSPLEKTGSRRFYAHGVVENWDVRRTIAKIQGLCFASPLYGFYRNPDPGIRIQNQELPQTALPDLLPLLAFDLQKPDQKLRVDQIDGIPGWDNLCLCLAKHPEWRAPTLLDAVGVQHQPGQEIGPAPAEPEVEDDDLIGEPVDGKSSIPEPSRGQKDQKTKRVSPKHRKPPVAK